MRKINDLDQWVDWEPIEEVHDDEDETIEAFGYVKEDFEIMFDGERVIQIDKYKDGSLCMICPVGMEHVNEHFITPRGLNRLEVFRFQPVKWSKQ